MKKLPCNICKADGCVFLALNKVPPIQNNFQISRDEAQAFSTTQVSYAWCEFCHHLTIVKEKCLPFDSSYNNEQVSSEVAIKHHINVLEKIKLMCPARDAHIVEIGCGRGEFLKLLIDAGYHNVRGFDPTANDSLGGVICSELWDGERNDGDIDLLILRHTLEEIPDVDQFMGKVAKANVKHVYCEITNAAQLYYDQDVLSLYPEYINLFSTLSISKLLSNFGFSVLSIADYFNNKWLGVFGINAVAHAKPLEWNFLLEKYSAAIQALERPIVIWGGGGRGGNLLAFCEISLNVIEYVVDQNIEKQGCYIPPVGQKVISISELKGIQPKNLIVVSQKYVEEIKPHVPLGCNVLSMDELINSY